MSSTASTDTAVGENISETRQDSNEPQTSGAPPRVRILRYDQYYNQRTFSTTLRKTGKPVSLKKLNKKRPVLVVRRLIDSRGQHERTEIDVRSEALCEVLLEINRDVEGLTLTTSKPVVDMRLLFNSRTGLLKRLEVEMAKNLSNCNLIEDLMTAIQFIEEDYSGTIAEFVKLTTQEEVTYELLWALIPPNTLIYHYHHSTEQPQILLARSLTYTQDRDRGPYVDVKCDVITNDGKRFGLAVEHVEIMAFPGARKIEDLSAYPLSYYKDEVDLRKNAIQRGKKFAETKRCLFEISGFAVGEKGKFNTYGRVMIDPFAFRLFEPHSTLNLPVYRRLEQGSLTDEQYLICTPIVLGFCFGTKMWGGFAIDRLVDITWTDVAFRSLVLGGKQKQLIHALIRQHSMRASLFDDVVVGKGKGLIGLLCGNPGCGKTLTAEAIAEVTRRPLYAVSAGELGTRPEDVDMRLTRILELAQMWNAVLLLDEAEVFLQARSATDVARNALVSIFLRQLEYYQGILILTTNMIGQCDPAFESRIHFCIKYPDLDFDSRKVIWKTFLSKALENPCDFSEEDISRLAEHEMNGRQIKNTVSTARSIAMDQNSRLLIGHFHTVLEVVNDWHVARKGHLGTTAAELQSRETPLEGNQNSSLKSWGDYIEALHFYSDLMVKGIFSISVYAFVALTVLFYFLS